jgi:hypothetical protein
MGSKHNYSEDDIRDLFLQRALLGDDSEPVPGDVFGIYGLEFDNESPSGDSYPHDQHQLPDIDLSAESCALGGNDDLLNLPLRAQAQAQTEYFDPDLLMQESMSMSASASASASKIPNPDDMTMIDPFLDYNIVSS